MSLHIFGLRGRERARGRAVGRCLLGILVIPLLILSTPSRAANVNTALFQQLAETVTAEAVAGQTVPLADFATKAQAAIDFMRPGGQLQGPYVVNVAPWSSAIAKHFAAHLWELYQDDLDTLDRDWITRMLGNWQSAGGQIARLSWGVVIDGVSYPFDSVAVFDPAGNLLFDTVLAHTITAVEVQPDTLGEFRQASVASSDAKTVSGNYKVSNFFGSVNLTYEVTLKAEVAPYITTATNDAAMTMTAGVKTARGSTTGLAPIANPQVYFGTGGQYKIINTDAAKTPFKSRIWVSDAFQDGIYQVSGNDLGSGTTFNLSFGVSVKSGNAGASVGISIPGPGPLILVGSNSSASELFLGDVLYSDNLGLRYRGTFRDGGNFKLTNFLIRTGDDTWETGSVNASIPVYMAHEGVGVLELTGQSIGTLNPRAQYVRGDHIRQPTYTVTADHETVEVGDDVMVTVQIKNNSGAVEIRDGSVALDAGTLGGVLTPKSATVVSFGSIGAYRSQSVTFVLTAVRTGQVTFQADVEGRWGSPVPPDVTLRKKISLDDPIGVSPPGGGNGASSLGIVHSGDYNGDGRADIVWRRSTTGQVYGALLNGFNLLQEGVFYNEPNQAWQIVNNGDFYGDRHSDLLWWNNQTGQLYLMSMNGLGIAGGALVYQEANTAWQVVAVGDLNGDQHADLVWWNNQTGQVYGMLMNGPAIGQQGMIYQEANTAWHILTARDFSGDGKADLLWRNEQTGQVYLMSMNGLNIAGGALIYQEPNTAWRIVAVGDFNGDQRADLIWWNHQTGQVYGMLMNGAFIVQQGMIYQEANTTWQIAASGDYTGDGQADLLWHNTTTLQDYLMPMSGLNVLSGAIVYHETSDWRIVATANADAPRLPTSSRRLAGVARANAGTLSGEPLNPHQSMTGEPLNAYQPTNGELLNPAQPLPAEAPAS
ncbi:MAG: VCBS repeat-containing protein [Gammaproteobacteria bacterium]|nr:VCBS repeat-containing protein [Gammaproteobacteria bacterium]MCP5196535.1 VCBS repeat-containing protein [Gammaproteobacteria bacterium]